MPKYIYKLYSDIDKKFYIGSCEDIKSRMDNHKKIPVNKKVKEWYDEIGFENVKYEILKSFDNIDKESLLVEEDKESKKYLNVDPNCLNVQRAKLSDEERVKFKSKYTKKYREKNKNKVEKYQREYYNNNKEKVLSRNRSYKQTHREERKLYNKEYRLNNKEKLKKSYEENGKRYRLNGKEKQKEWANRKLECPLCGCTRTFGSFIQHQYSKTCLKNAMERLSV